MEMQMETETVGFTLPDRKVLVTPIRRKGGWLPDGHAASFLHNNAYWDLVVPRDIRNGELRDPLTKEERTFFESRSAGLALNEGDLLVTKREDNYWDKYRIKLRDEVLPLDLSKPKDYIMYKVLLANEETIAPSAVEKFKKGTYKFAIVDEEYKNEEKVAAASNKKEAYRFFGKIDSSLTKMKDFLNVYYTQKPGGKSVPVNASQEFLIAEIEKIIEGDLTGFLTLCKDKNYEKKVLIWNAMRASALRREGMMFVLPDGAEIGENMQSVIAFLDNPANSDEVIKMKARIDNAK
jgi:hypothetical protein